VRDDRYGCAMRERASDKTVPPSYAAAQPGAFPIAKADKIEGMVKGMAVLEAFDTERQRLNATLAAERAGITRAAARRHLLTLAHLGYLETDGSYFWLASKVLRLSGSYLASARLPTHATSTGRILLAAKSAGELETWLQSRADAGGLPRLNVHTAADPQQLRALVDQARTDGFCIVSEVHELGVHALAVPLRDLQGRTVAALNGVTSPQRMTAAALQHDLLPLLLDAARELRPLL